MSILYECEIPDLQSVYLRDPAPELVTWQGRKALKMSGQGGCLLVLPGLSLAQGSIEVEIGADGPCYSGIAFRLLDSLNYELAYVQPHTSGLWDALQYDPVFHGSNTWQLYHGAGNQLSAQVPTGAWFHMLVAFQGQRAKLQVDGQEPLWVPRLAHAQPDGLVGLWSYLPACFRNLRVRDDLPEFPDPSTPPQPVLPAAGALLEWFLEGFGLVRSEPGGILNLNRYLPNTTREVRLLRDIQLAEEAELTFTFGFSDQLSLQIDAQEVFSGENLWHNTPAWAERGYVSLDRQVTRRLSKGRHRLTAVLKAAEYFGYGMALSIAGNHWDWLPVSIDFFTPAGL